MRLERKTFELSTLFSEAIELAPPTTNRDSLDDGSKRQSIERYRKLLILDGETGSPLLAEDGREALPRNFERPA